MQFSNNTYLQGNLWETILNGACGQSVCKRVGKNLERWEKCPRPVTEEMLDKLYETMALDNKAVMAAFSNLRELLKKVDEKVEGVRGSPSAVWQTAVTQTVEHTAVAGKGSLFFMKFQFLIFQLSLTFPPSGDLVAMNSGSG